MKLNSTINSLHVLVTRPIGLAEPLCNEIESRGGTATHFPVIEINDPGVRLLSFAGNPDEKTLPLSLSTIPA